MARTRLPVVNRRTLLAGGSALLAASTLSCSRAIAQSAREYTLLAAPARVPIVDAPHGRTNVWAFGGQVPGPEIRIRQGERLRLVAENGLPEATTVHCHGIRLPNAMDGVPHLTQEPILPGAKFVYEFACPDAGTFWYHPHANSAAQVGRGLYGALIVEEHEPPPVDREVVWVLDDWRLQNDGSIHPDFRNLHDITHAGRIGNTITLNGRVTDTFPVQAGERIRLRLISVTNARVFALDFEEHAPVVIAIDGQPVEPHAPPGGRIVLGPGMRMDLMLDLSGKPGGRYAIRDDFYPRASYTFLELAYAERPLRDSPLTGNIRLPANPLSEPDCHPPRGIRSSLAAG
jgi:FtsP/CotA-like multicopper oxidase with cupredoxin domain